MSPRIGPRSPERVELLRWAAGIGAVTAEALAYRDASSLASARARLSAAERDGLLRRHRLLLDRPALYTVARSGMRAAGVDGIEPCRVSAGSAEHMIACALVAAELHRRYPDQIVIGERELRMRERRAGAPLASAAISWSAERVLMHRPDLAVLPSTEEGRGAIAVEVELTIKAPSRLRAICRAWARARHVGGVLYLAPAPVERALLRAIHAAQAEERIVVLPLGALGQGPAGAPSARSIPSGL
ncbi:MAG TPA: hypothetical protein VHW67_10895 [Solirubrobacteraceae bacterium]|jgi:hypothetical protein|nr:hypothetical protein [Solirubrobacteraceae bacterium]